MSKEEYWVFCKDCGDDVCAKVEDTCAWHNPELEVEVLVCPNCDKTICDLGEYVEAENESRAEEMALDRARGI